MTPLTWLHANSHYVSLELNPQRSNYRTVAEEIALLTEIEAADAKDLPPDVRAECIKRDSLVVLHVYKDTMVGHYTWYHYDAEEVIAIAHRELGGQS